jgi:hypothetical protein
MTKSTNARRWLTIAMIDALLLFGAGSAMATPSVTSFEPSVHLPTVLLAGISLVWVALAHRQAK